MSKRKWKSSEDFLIDIYTNKLQNNYKEDDEKEKKRRQERAQAARLATGISYGKSAVGSLAKTTVKPSNSSTSTKKSSYSSPAVSQSGSKGNTPFRSAIERGKETVTTKSQAARFNTGLNSDRYGNGSARGNSNGVKASTTTSYREKQGINLKDKRQIEKYDTNRATKLRNNKFDVKSGQTVSGAGKQWLGGQLSSVGTTAQELETTARSYNKAKAEAGNTNYSLRSRQEAERRQQSAMKNLGVKEGINLKNVERRYDLYDPNGFSQRLIKTGDRLIESGTQDIEEAKKGLGKVGRLGVDLGANAIQMAGDRMMAFVPGVGQALAMGSLMNRAGGTASYEARQSGMNPDQQFMYQQGTAMIEGLSEGIFNSVSAFRSTYGKGAFSLADKVSTKVAASKIVQDFLKNNPTGKALATNLARLGAQGFEEGIEEVVADLAEPALKYALIKSTDPNAKFEGYNAKDIAYDFLIGALMGGIPGGVEAMRGVSTDVQMSQAMADGKMSVDKLISQGLVQGREGANVTNAEVLANQMRTMQEQGKEIQPIQARMLQEALGESVQMNANAFERRGAEETVRASEEGRLQASTGTATEESAYRRGARTVEEKNVERAKSVMGEGASETSTEALGRVLSGSADIDDHTTILADSKAREAVEELTGEKLSVNNAKARDQLETLTLANEITNKDTIRKEVQTVHAEDIAKELTSMNNRGGQIFKENYDEAVKVIGSGTEYLDVFQRLYTDGTVKESSFDEAYNRIVLQRGGAVAEFFTEPMARKAFNAGRVAMVAEEGKAIAKSKANKASETGSGISFEGNARKKISDRQADLLTKFAERANVHIRIQESVYVTDKNGNIVRDENGKPVTANGMYKDGIIYLAADAENKLITVAKHELTHHIRQTAPERYQELEDFVFQKWYDSDADAMEDKVARYQRLYDCTAEEAREEIIADASEAFFTDDAAIHEVLSFSEKLGKAIRDGIHTLLDNFLDLQDTEDTSDNGYGDFLKDINILKEAEQKWLDALNESVGRGRNAETPTEAQVETEAKKSLKFSDQTYLDAVKSGKTKLAQSMVDEKASSIETIAKDSKGRPIHLYHGTPRFGFTVFKDSQHNVPFIYTSTDRTVSAHYAGDNHYASARPIGTSYKTGNSVKDILENARNVLGADMKVMSKADKKARYDQVREEAVKVADKLEELESKYSSFNFYTNGNEKMMNAVAWVENQFWTIRDGDFQYDFDNDNRDNDEWRKSLEEDVERFKDNIGIVKEYYNDNYKSLTEGEKALLSYLIGYDLGDVAIDIEYGMLRVATEEDILSNQNGGNIIKPSDLKENMDRIHNIGAYDMYGDLGSKPFEFDAKGAQFWAVEVPQMGDGYFSTDQICKWASENGYTSVIMHNIYDYGDKADNYVFFDSSQLKSADPVTYDDNGEVIPLSERFNEKNDDIRYSRKQDQYDILQNANPMLDTYHTGIRSAKDIKNASEVFARKDFSGTPDWTYEDAQKSLKSGKITVFSSKPIVDGTFVTPSMMEAESYAGEGNFYQAEVPIEDVAWIDSVEGQYAKVSNEAIQSEPKFSIKLMNHAAAKPVMDEGGKVVGARVFRDKNGDPLLMSGLEVTSETMRLMGKESKIPFVKRFLEKQARFMEKMGEKYTFIGLKDVSNADLEVRRDKNGNPVSIVVSAMVKNGEYPVNFDFSSICKKRQALSKPFEKLSTGENGEFLDSVELSVENLWKINEILSENGFETACLGCFVETKRYGIENWADTFAEKWNKAVLEKNPNAEYFNFASSKDIDFGYVSDEMDRFAENKKDEREKESKRRKKERASFIKKWLKNNPGETEANAEKAYKQWWKKAYNLKADQYKESWFESPALSNDKAIAALVNSGDKMQKLIRKTDLISPKGLKALMALHPDFYGVLYGHFGSGTPKPMVSFTPYNSEIALLGRQVNPNGGMKRYTPEANATLVNKLVEIGGVRIQSFSDFLIQNTFDYMQMVADMAARNFPAHAYTKEIAFAKIFGLTGIKINLSVMFDVDPDGIAPGLDKDGNYVVADKSRQEREKKNGNHVFAFSISYDEAVKLQNSEGYDGNVGIIGVGLSDLHIRKMLNDPDIKMVIPYHSSGMPAVIKQLTKLGADSDYTSTQNTLDISKIERDGVDVTKQYGKDYMLDLYKEKGSWKEAFAQFRKDTEGCTITPVKAFASTGNFPLYTGDPVMSLDATNDPKRTAEYYMGWCIENGHFPLFYQFADEENYYKVLYDFNVYHNDGTYAPQNAVENEYPEDLESVIEQYMKEANDFEQAQMPKWDNVINETKEMLKSNSYKEESNGKFSRKTSDSKKAVENQNTIAKLEEQVADLKAEFKRTNLKTADPKQVRIQAGRLIKRHGSYIGVQEDVIEAFNKIFAIYKEKGFGAFDEVSEIATDTARIIVGNIWEIKQEAKDQWNDVKEYIRKNPIVVTPEMKRNIPDWGAFWRRNFSRIQMKQGEFGNLDEKYYDELRKRLPTQFEEDYNTPAEMLMHIEDVLDNYKDTYVRYDAMSPQMRDYVASIATDILWTAYNLQTRKTFADKKYEEKVKAVAKAREEALASRKKALNRQKERYEKKLDTLKQKHQDFKENTRENAEKKRRIKQISNVYKRLLEKLQTPSDTKHLPDGYAPVVSNILKMFDFTTPGMEKWAERNGEPSRRYKYMLELRKQLDEMSKNEGSELEVDPDLLDLVDEIMADIGENQRLIDMDSKTLEDIAVLFRAFEHQMNSYNKAFDEANKKTVSDTAHSIFDHLDETKKSKWHLGVMGRLLTSNFNPSDFFELVGGDVANLYNATRLGFDKYVDRLDNAKTFLQDMVDNKTADKWANNVKTYETSDGEKIELTDTQLMSLYCLNRREQAQGHIYGGGIVSAPLKVRKNKITTTELEKTRVIPSMEDVGKWFNTLTDEQKRIADSIQRYFVDEVSEWGNETSMKLYNYKKFGEKNYFPIQSSSDYMASNFDQRGNDPVLKNMGMTKALTKNASNAIVVDDIFTVFSKHVAQMASYNAYVPAITDFQRVWNYTEGNDQDMVKARFENVYGRKAADYIENFFKNLNGVYKANFDPTILDKGLGLFKKAAVGGNIRVLVQQPTAIARAALLVNPIYLSAAMPLATAKPKRTYKEMMDHCPIARWKTWGFYSSDITSASRDLKNIMIGKNALTDKIFMDMYGVADNVTWTVIFKACELQVEAQNKGLKKGSDEYWQKVNELASRVFDRTQVVDSPFHRSEIMKSQNGITKMATAFMAEPTKTINMLNTELTKAGRELKNGNHAKATGIFVRVGMVITANAAALAMAQALVDAMRHAGGDDDKDKGDYKDRFRNYWKSNFADNLNPIGMIPYVKDIKSLWDGYDVTRMDMNGVQKVVQAIQYLQKYYENPEESKYSAQEEWTNLALSTAYAIGVPISNAKRDIEGLYVSIMEGTGHPEVFFHQAKRKYQVNDKTKSMFAGMYTDALEQGNTALANEIKKYMMDNGVNESYITGKAKDYARENPTDAQTNSYQESLKMLEGSSLWYNNDSAYIEGYDKALRDIALGISTETTKNLKKFEDVGISPEENVLIRLAMEKSDKIHGDNNGSVNKDEKLYALDMLRHAMTLTEEEKKAVMETTFRFTKGRKKS